MRLVFLCPVRRQQHKKPTVFCNSVATATAVNYDCIFVIVTLVITFSGTYWAHES